MSRWVQINFGLCSDWVAAESKWKIDFTVWLVFGLSLSLQLRYSLSERLSQKCNDPVWLASRGPRLSIILRSIVTKFYCFADTSRFLPQHIRAQIVWSWPTISSWTSQIDDIVAHWLDTMISLCCYIVISYASVQSVGPYNLIDGQCSLIYLAHHCYDWHPGSRCG